MKFLGIRIACLGAGCYLKQQSLDLFNHKDPAISLYSKDREISSKQYLVWPFVQYIECYMEIYGQEY